VVFPEELFELGHEFILDCQDEEFDEFDRIMLTIFETFDISDPLYPILFDLG